MPRKPKLPPPEPKRHERRRGTGSIRELSPGVWRAWKPPNAAGKRESRRFVTQDAARRWLDGVQEPAVLYLGAYLETFYALRAPTIRPNTARNYRTFFALAELIATVPLADLSSDDCQALINSLLLHYARTTVESIRTALSVALNAAVPRYIAYNPMKSTRLPKAIEPPALAWRRDEILALKHAVQGSQHEAWLYVALGTGLRLGELRALEWADVDLRELTVRVDKSVENNGYGVGPTKTGRPRVVDLPDEVPPLLVAHRARQSARERLVFGRGNRPLAAQTYRDWLKRLCGRAGVRPLKVHATRHTFASVALAENTPIPDVSQALGHATITTTLNIYGHFVNHGRRGTAKAMSTVLGPENEGVLRHLHHDEGLTR